MRGAVAFQAALAVSLVGCGPGKVATALRPEDPKAAPALCADPSEEGQPLIVDWLSHERAGLETAMADGVAVVHYDCETLRLLKDCHIEGSYAFRGVSKKEDVIQLVSADEIRVNLPAYGATLSAEVGRSSALDLAMIMVGMRRTTVRGATRAQLTGSCDGATHYVRGAYVGAFAMQTGTQGKVAAAATLFDVGPKASSVSAKSTARRDGDPDKCAQAARGAKEGQPGCDSALRLELNAIGHAAPPLVGAGTGAGQPDVCPKDFVLSAGKCRAASASQEAFQCRADDEAACRAQCARGHGGSCTALAILHMPTPDRKGAPGEAFAAASKACDAGSAEGCNALGWAYENGFGATADLTKAGAQYQSACDRGVAMGCLNLGRAHLRGRGVKQDTKKALSLFDLACSGGEAVACHNLGVTLHREDPARARRAFQRACTGGMKQSCKEIAKPAPK